jgi:2,3-bisphosphoglycerate-dependent phosphoglycerate mutase
MQFDLHRFDAAFMSVLERTTMTYDLMVSEMRKHNMGAMSPGDGFKNPTIRQSWRLNERHYGALVGLSKAEAETTMGKESVMGWRRSWDQRPPPMIRHPYFQALGTESDGTGSKSPRFDWQTDIWTKAINIEINHGQPPLRTLEKNAVIPLSESLKDCAERVLPLWQTQIVPRIIEGETVLIVAHSNTIRGLVKHIDKDTLSDEDLRQVTIPSAMPMIYSFDRYGRADVKPRGKLSPLGVRGRFVVNREVLTLSLAASQNMEMSENLEDTTAFKDLLRNTLDKLNAQARVSAISMSSFDADGRGSQSQFVMEPGWMSFPVKAPPVKAPVPAVNEEDKKAPTLTVDDSALPGK